MTQQLSIDFARHQRDIGMARAEAGAEDACEGWGDLALQFIRLYVAQHAGRFTAEDVVEAADEWGLIKPPSDKAWGPIFRRAAVLGIIRKDGFAVCRKRHCSPTVAWRRG